jgi:hypothetical protein
LAAIILNLQVMGKVNKRLLIGASSPLGYFYGFDREKLHGKPAPILESPLSYSLLYDEIWFLNRKVCPHNMENLDFVHFVDEDLMPEGLPKDFFNTVESNPFGQFPWENWKESIKNTIGLRWNFDNHSRSTKFGELLLTPTPGNYQNLVIDRYIATTHGMDLVENSANSIWSQKVDKDQLQLSVSEKLLVSPIISLQTIDGPWHPEIANLREDSLLKKYRQKIQTVTIDEISEIDKRVGELSKEFEKISSKIVTQHFETNGLFVSAAMFLIGLIPVLGNIAGGGQVLKDIHDKIKLREEKGWVGFLGKAKQSLS